MPILALPLEIIYLIVEQLTTRDLWSVYDCCHGLRACAARFLFCKVSIKFDESTPALLNARYFRPPRSSLLQCLRQWSSYVRTVDIWGDEEMILPGFFDVLRGFDRLRARLLGHLSSHPTVETLSVDFMSPRTWQPQMIFSHLRELHLSCIEHEPGLCILPPLPVLERLSLNFCCYCLECPKSDNGPCTQLLFEQLPQLLALSISGARQGSIVCRGYASHLRRFELSFSTDIDLAALCPTLGVCLEEVVIADCELVGDMAPDAQRWPYLRRLRISDSVSAVALLGHVQLPPSADVHVRIHPTDVQHLFQWPLVLQALSTVPVTVSFSSHPDLPYPHCLPLHQLMTLPTVQIDKFDRPWLVTLLQESRTVQYLASPPQSTDSGENQSN
ncbi:hypothetical protein CBS147321_7957 [Aspergillus niger]|uniref:Permease for cytosine/purine, uracil, thiamine, allantoin family protein n=1 Tax=Aspergillus niger TaxID=5061 RepID=A0A254U4U9_ASPNG|nr:hypothetical protein CBS12448_11081 [Aspergillus niger]KAI2937242.1 hypothetical protein CBS147321_7957 [Aspergillus niger]KAI2944538.1 hypothetical protein CBS147322_8067 [Aspergillus niger]KAI2984440.1 hypothetical protein CBS147345_11114 [Aspergillus niger]TPR10111.1 Permease for cytosine/purine, uracil, thiamine, allantoin family protein [Aspergillus niger]